MAQDVSVWLVGTVVLAVGAAAMAGAWWVNRQRQPPPVAFDGVISITGLPEHYGLVLNLCFYRVNAADSALPFSGDPPAEAATDCHKVLEQVDLEVAKHQEAYDVPFNLIRAPGHFYVQVRAILFRKEGDRVLAQAEQFFQSRPVSLPLAERITLPAAWPTQPVGDLHHHQTITPERK